MRLSCLVLLLCCYLSTLLSTSLVVAWFCHPARNRECSSDVFIHRLSRRSSRRSGLCAYQERDTENGYKRIKEKLSPPQAIVVHRDPLNRQIHFFNATSFPRIDDDESYYSQEHRLVVDDAAQKTWNWCAHFVVPYSLCPWAAASVQTQGAIRLYVVQQQSLLEEAIREVSRQFRRDLEEAKSADPNTAIAFVILVDDDNNWEFESFYEWFVTTEDAWLDEAETDSNHVGNYITMAPFHPDWHFEGGEFDDDPLCFEKKSPYPTVSLVSSAVIDKAGPAATSQIADHNAETLQQKTVLEWEALYEQAIQSPS